MRILCVAEKNSIANEISKALGGGAEIKRRGRSKFNPVWDLTYNFSNEWRSSSVTVTSVSGHVTHARFPSPFDNFSYDPHALFNAPIEFSVIEGNQPVAANLEAEGRKADILYIWTDCDREGEFIGSEVVNIVRKVNRNIKVKRAVFSNVEPSHIRQAASRPQELNMRLVDAARARSELDLRTGYSMTRLQNRVKGSLDHDGVLSYGPCQFPTMGFVIDRYLKIKNFVPETFWKINLNIKAADDEKCLLNWDRNRLFDHASATILYEKMLLAGGDPQVTNISSKQTKQFKPLPLTTVTLQKLGVKFLGLSGKTIMEHAEKLYQKGFISYPRTETDQFDSEIDLRKLVERLQTNSIVGSYAHKLLAENKFNDPRRGKHNDKAHPPIHPVQSLGESNRDIKEDTRKVYEFISRYFLACCSDDAKGEQTTVNVEYGGEKFHVTGVIVKELNYLEVYIYGKWSSTAIPKFERGQTLNVVSCMIAKGETTAPAPLTEPELISLMDANGIGTDATIAEHISTVKSRAFIVEKTQGKKAASLLPTNLGMALYTAYAGIDLPKSVTQPHLRQETERSLTQVAAGQLTKHDVMTRLISDHESIFLATRANMKKFIELAKNEFTKNS